MTTLEFGIVPDLTVAQAAKVDEALTALKEFLVAPNETATEKNNALQKLAGEARKAVLNIQPKVKAKKETK